MLNEIVEDAEQFSGYDIIVDDGGHKASQMLTSFRVSDPSALAASQGPKRVTVPLYGCHEHL